ncbi:MAG: phosphoribosylanthranilate isomerase [Phycisphaerae bacterium]|nr:phosphoribosylanthranilate isomerase [Phycisphaerae bacterium]
MSGPSVNVWVKICGITNQQDARFAFEVGADAIGVNFVGGPRKVTLATAEAILEAVPEHGMAIALVELSSEGLDPHLAELLQGHRVRHIQVYGDVSTESIIRLVDQGYHPLRVCRLKTSEPRHLLAEATVGLTGGELFAIVLDAHVPGKQGGTGQTLDWEALGKARGRGEMDGFPPIVLAGGLNPDNVSRAIKIVRPWGVDVSSGVEAAPGQKDHEAIRRFVRAAKQR